MEKTWFTITLVLITVIVLTSATTFHYYSNWVLAEERYRTTLESLQDLSYTVNVLIQSGDNQIAWYNDTRIPIGWSLYNTTEKVSKGQINGVWSEFGVFVTSINNVDGNGPAYWLWFTWDEHAKQWSSGMTGADAHIMRENETVAWLLTEDWMATP
ncbi:MAG: hypothetical protein JSV76_00115 [Candidatus Bathyarchaeota archaeon]|nr:MAG: hypothetical protein JSV76_00115 [Candidatus Bathyarchaeota archaeon]